MTFVKKFTRKGMWKDSQAETRLWKNSRSTHVSLAASNSIGVTMWNNSQANSSWKYSQELYLFFFFLFIFLSWQVNADVV